MQRASPRGAAERPGTANTAPSPPRTPRGERLAFTTSPLAARLKASPASRAPNFQYKSAVSRSLHESILADEEIKVLENRLSFLERERERVRKKKEFEERLAERILERRAAKEGYNEVMQRVREQQEREAADARARAARWREQLHGKKLDLQSSLESFQQSAAQHRAELLATVRAEKEELWRRNREMRNTILRERQIRIYLLQKKERERLEARQREQEELVRRREQELERKADMIRRMKQQEEERIQQLQREEDERVRALQAFQAHYALAITDLTSAS